MEPADTREELQARWEYYVPIPLPETSAATNEAPGKSAQLVDVLLQPSVFSHARLDLADLRLFDTSGNSIPYALRQLRPDTERDRVPAVEFNRSEPDDGPQELTLDLNENEIQHNEIEIITSGENFRRNVTVEVSDDNQSWRPLVDGQLIRFSDGDQKINRQSIAYPGSRFRYLRVRVSPDPGPLDRNREKDEFTIQEVHVLHHVDVPGELLLLQGKLGAREPVRNYGANGSAWEIELGGANVPCDRIIVDIADVEFARDVQLEYEVWDQYRSRPVFQPVLFDNQPLWQRRIGDDREPMVLTFTEVQTSRLRLRITDHRNIPLTIQSVTFGAAARQIVFARPTGDQKELRLYFGNPMGEPPNYDFERNLPAKIVPPPARTTLGNATRNPDFVPPPKPFTERFPGLIYAVLAGVSVVLAGVIIDLSRKAIAIHDSVATHSL